MKKLLLIPFCIGILNSINAQDTFSIVAADSVTGEVGSAGASCLDMIYFPDYSYDFLGELFPGVGAINTQASYDPGNQGNAQIRMNEGDSPSQIISWLIANDVTGKPDIRQYGIVRLINGSPKTAGHTGINCINYKNHIAGKNYCIQGNILLGQNVLDSMEARFKREPGDLACKLMAAMQGANMVGADTRCASNGTSSLFAFLKVSKPSDPFGSPYFNISLATRDGAGIEPVDSLQQLFNAAHASCAPTGLKDHHSEQIDISIYPNPVINTFIVKVANNRSGEMICTIRDVVGRKIVEERLSTEKTIDFCKFENGIYFIEVTDGIKRTTRKIVKQ
ncbi:MAG: DUF1028 domain-containing protein [Bacteroidota bacterium]